MGKETGSYSSYKSILEQSTDEFIDYLYGYIPTVDMNINDMLTMQTAGERMMHISNIIVFLSELEARAGLLKREAKWEADESKNTDEKKAKKKKYEDMVDKEKIISKAIHSLEIQYRAINRALTVYMDTNKDQYMPQGLSR